MKRSRSVKRVLLGGLMAGAIAASAGAAERITPDSYYTNDTFIPGAGYYHAPFRGFYPHPYNQYDPARRQYYYGGQWGPEPYRSIINISAPTPQAASTAEANRTDIVRGGFGRTSTSHFIRS